MCMRGLAWLWHSSDGPEKELVAGPGGCCPFNLTRTNACGADPRAAQSMGPTLCNLQPETEAILEQPSQGQPVDSGHENIWCCNPLSLGVVRYVASLQH